MPNKWDDEEDEERLADRVLLQTWREMRREMTREEAEAEAVAAMEESPLFGGVALRDLEREDRGRTERWARTESELGAAHAPIMCQSCRADKSVQIVTH